MKKLYIITPSSNIKDEMDINKDIEIQIKNSEILLSSININIIYWSLFKKSNLWYWWTKQERLDEIHNWFKNKDINFIMSSQWWYNINELLWSLDYDLIKKNYKPIIWLSDITILLNAIYKKTWRITYHWYDLIRQIWKSWSNYSINILNNFFNNWILEKKLLWKVLNKEVKYWEWILIGWSIPSYSLILWSEYDPIELDKNFIFFIEDIWENYERIISYIDQLLLNKKFINNCKWFLIWHFSFCNYENEKNYDFNQILLNKLKILNIPILKIDNIWHIVENPILPIWKNVKIENNFLNLNIWN